MDPCEKKPEPLQVLLDVVVSVEFGQSGESPGGAASVTLPAQTAVTHSSTDGTLPRLQETQAHHHHHHHSFKLPLVF